MIKLIIFDIDGTLTDGKIYMDDKDNSWKAFNVKDGFAIVQWIKQGGLTAIITGKASNIVARRKEELKIHDLYQGIDNKVEKLYLLMEKYNLKKEEIAYIGDDINDLGIMTKVGFSACPYDAVDEVKERVDYIAKSCGGNGAVREILEHIMKSNGMWEKVIQTYLNQ